MLEQLIYNFGYIGIFIIAFLASTLIPLGSETFVILMANLGYNTWLILLFATTGNYLGSLTNYYIGKYGNEFFLSKKIKYSSKIKKKAEEIYSKYGAPTLFLSWLPIIGDPLCIVPGILHLDIRIFSFWVILGKLFRYSIILGITNILI